MARPKLSNVRLVVYVAPATASRLREMAGDRPLGNAVDDLCSAQLRERVEAIGSVVHLPPGINLMDVATQERERDASAHQEKVNAAVAHSPPSMVVAQGIDKLAEFVRAERLRRQAAELERLNNPQFKVRKSKG